jgi:hypothetical protein
MLTENSSLMARQLGQILREISKVHEEIKELREIQVEFKRLNLLCNNERDREQLLLERIEGLNELASSISE